MKIATTKERILQFIEHKQISKQKFFNQTGLKRGILDGDKLKTSIPDTFIAIIIATYEELSPEWLLTGKGAMLRSTAPMARQPAAGKEPEAPPPTSSDVVAIYKELLRERDEEIKALNRRIWEFERKDELIKKLRAEIEHLKNEVRKLRGDIDEPRSTVAEVRKMPLIPPRLEPPMYEYNHPE
jgi:hypothetical protein